MTKPEDRKLLRKFLLKAATEKDENKRLKYFGEKSDDPDIVALDNVPDFVAARKAAGIELDQGKKWIPPKSLCKELADWMDWLEEYGGSPKSPPHDFIYLAIRFAMPLVPTAEEDGAAG